MLVLLLLITASFIPFKKNKDQPVPFWSVESKWVDSVFASLNADEKIGQLFMVAAYSNKDMKHVREVRELIQKYNIGGLIFMQGGPVREAKLTNYYQTLAKTKLLIAIDGEWGLAMRLDSVPQYPRQMTLGAIQNDSLIYEMGKQIALECKRMGIHVNFAPVADVNNNPENPVISVRSFGENKYAVAKKAYMYMAGMQDNGIMANGKHFPGHGDTDSDSHKTLPTILHNTERLDSLELYPFKYLFERNLASIMVAHLNIPAYDTTQNQASTLSKKVVSDLLKTKLGFKGLIFTDALNMKGASKYNAPGVVDMKALLAGNDVLLFSENVPKAITEIKAAIERGDISQEEVDEHVKKILKAKYWCGLDKKQFVHLKNLKEELNTLPSDLLNTKLAEASVTLLQNNNSILPLKQVDTLRIAEISIGMEEATVFSQYLNKYVKADHFGLSNEAKQKDRDSLLAKLKNYNLLIVQVNKTNNKPNANFGLSTENMDLIRQLGEQKKSIISFFSNPYLLGKLKGLENYAAIVNAYEYNRFSQKAAAEAIVGAIRVSGKLPVSCGSFKPGIGIVLKNISRIQYIIPEQIGIDSKKLCSIDSIALQGIKDECYPGCQIVALKDGKIFYQKSFGKYTYLSNQKVNNESIYDLASVTKVASSSIALMDMVSRNKVDVNKTLVQYLPELSGSNKADIVLKEMLTHQAGLQAWIPFYLRTLSKHNDYREGYYSTKQSDEFPTRVAENLYVKKGYTDSIYARIIESKLEKKGEYLYSDLGYYFTKKIIEQSIQTPLNEYVRSHFYQPMGLYSLCYKPRDYFNLERLVPTENDTKFRKQLVHGDVHDQGAALMGGVAGHAGLFGNATDLATLMQMLVNKGNYNGVQYLDSNVVKVFTQGCEYCPLNRRGLCFDKPEPDEKKESPVIKECSLQSFGHSGFTGTFTWADPVNGLVYVFLSNRVNPDAEKNKLVKSGIRGKIHKVFYEAITPPKNTP